MASVKNTLLVRHLPSELEESDQVELLQHFGALHVRCMGKQGALKNSAFATFPNEEAAKHALSRLHQLELMGSLLVVEFSRQRYVKHHPQVMDCPIKIEEKEEKSEVTETPEEEISEKQKISDKVNSVGSRLGLDYPMNPRLRYIYPSPNVNILTNIANALASVPKFYVQVLHLMNKMNLPPPFSAVTPMPPIPEAPPELPPMPEEPDILEMEDMEVSSSEESELESDGETHQPKTKKASKRSLSDKNKPRKRHKLQHIVYAPKVQIPTAKPNEVFDTTELPSAKKLEFKINALSKNLTTTDEVLPFDATNSTGFGKIEPSKGQEVVEEDDDDNEVVWGDSKFISTRRLRKGRLSRSELRDISLFKNYNPGEPTSRLYIKNLSKSTTEKDLHYIFGRYVNWDSEVEKLMFDIRLMKEGRMKGQAFVTLPNEISAKKAVEDTNAYELHDKPMIVSFARSAKPKETGVNNKKGKP